MIQQDIIKNNEREDEENVVRTNDDRLYTNQIESFCKIRYHRISIIQKLNNNFIICAIRGRM